MTIISVAAGERGAIPSPRPGMGAIPHEAGCTFRVWAPFARSVHVAGRFNRKPLQRVLYTESHDEFADGKSRLFEEIWPGNAGSWFMLFHGNVGIGPYSFLILSQ